MTALTVDGVRNRNVRAVEALYASERSRDIEAWQKLWRADGRQTFPHLPDAAVAGLPRLIEVTRAKFAERPPYEIHVEIAPFADPSRVMARLRLVVDAVAPPVELWCIFQFDEDGLIAEVEEMFDSGRGATFPG